LLLLVAASCLRAEPALKRFEFQRAEMGSVMKIDLYAADEAIASKAADAAFARVEALNQVCSDYIPDSELIRLCRAREMPVSDDLLNVITRGLDIAQRTSGAFDITCGHYTNLWRRAKRKGVLPDAAQLAKARALTGWSMVQVKDHCVELAKDGMQLDLGGIAKGFAADTALAVLKQRGLTRAVVAASGDLAIGDAPPGKAGWEVKLRTFESAEATDKLITLRLQHRGISTSGDLHQFAEIAGQRYSHIVDPATGLGLTRRIACSVLAPDATTSDALATAMCVQGVEKGMETAKQFPGVSIRFTKIADDGTVQATSSATFPKGN
jgi:thiamine biosynthesis lipoprotein